MARVAHPRLFVQNNPQRPALIMADTGQVLSYGQLVERSDRGAQLLTTLGLQEGDTIAIFLENHICYPELCWAAKNAGITYACIPSRSTVEEVAYIVDNCDAKLLISSIALRDTAVKVAQHLAQQCQYLMVDGEVGAFANYEVLLQACEPRPLKGRRRGPSMLYSSGTTGKPKGIRSPLPDAPPEEPPPRLAMLEKMYQLSDQTVFINPGPFYHAAPGRFMICLHRLGGTVISFKRFDPEACLAAIDAYQATHGLFVPTMFTRILCLDSKVKEMYRHDSLRCVAHLGAPCPIPIKEQMIQWWGPILGETYAGTEAVGHTYISSLEWLEHKGSVGRPAGNCELRIVDDSSGEDMPAGEPGLIYMRNGKRFEYHKDSDKTKDAFIEGGWATLGDIGYLDEDGYLYLTDRKADMIVSGGVNVYPREAENVLHRHPLIADVAVVGVPDEELGEVVKAVVEIEGDNTLPNDFEADVIAFCRQYLAPQKCPRSVDIVEELPRNEAGKLLKRLVRDRYWQDRASRLV